MMTADGFYKSDPTGKETCDHCRGQDLVDDPGTPGAYFCPDCGEQRRQDADGTYYSHPGACTCSFCFTQREARVKATAGAVADLEAKLEAKDTLMEAYEKKALLWKARAEWLLVDFNQVHADTGPLTWEELDQLMKEMKREGVE